MGWTCSISEITFKFNICNFQITSLGTMQVLFALRKIINRSFWGFFYAAVFYLNLYILRSQSWWFNQKFGKYFPISKINLGWWHIKSVPILENSRELELIWQKLWLFMFSSAYWIKLDRIAARSMAIYWFQ